MAKGNVLDGVFANSPLLLPAAAINKPYGMSSAQVIRDCQTYFNPSNMFRPMMEEQTAQRIQESNSAQRRRKRDKRRIQVKLGHGGTLDPLATGVLILGLGKGTKALNQFLNCTKTYETVVVFGASTDTYDRCGVMLKQRQYDHITRPMVEEALKSFRGTYQQMPPLYSALKMEGKPLYEYAREGKPIPREIATREVTCTNMELVEWYEPGTHHHHWPGEEGTAAEKTYAEQVWRIEKLQTEGKKLTPEENEAESQALAAHESSKRKFEERQDDLVYDKQSKRRKHSHEAPMMSGALGEVRPPKGKGSDLIPPLIPNTPPPWEGKGPPAAKFRMTVTSGFYVRSFAHDLGNKVDSAAIMTELIRTRQGQFTLDGENCMEYDDLLKGERVWAPMLEGMLSRWNNNPTVDSAATDAVGSSSAAHSDGRVKDEPENIPESVETDPVEESAPKEASSKNVKKDDQPDLPSQTTVTSRPAEVEKATPSQDTLKVPAEDDSKSAKNADEESWAGFSDDPTPVQEATA
ncbi:putative trna pseudouridine synthase b protein [Phaeoacremonium minimum UCRPA7]|uniref:tRNA pseudouridine(55) synthase n=1 Tax=Phaeoacremonium minimum (strain UCR-PA7) TaxID=1286976 RepID=R8BHB9_PHAM7|nr:putative trna pseudouridine synthase b protein [Phaeoacremonium minimum UCRPA7]EON98637.1 putative trna pseudouridine synthase b protein [Phaeoacremonium minimum UCRPA7]